MVHQNRSFGNVALKLNTLGTDLCRLLHSARPSIALLDMTQSVLRIPLHLKEVRQELPNRLIAAKQTSLFLPLFSLQ